MGSTTPVYALPYPVGTDLVKDGDNAIQALAEKVESTLRTSRAWAARKTPPGTFTLPANTWTNALNLTLTGCPSGALVMVTAVAFAASPTNTTLAVRVTPVNATFAPAGLTPTVHTALANGNTQVSVSGIVTATAADPLLALEVQAGVAATGLDYSYIVANRVA